jgi:xanthine/uracil permease
MNDVKVAIQGMRGEAKSGRPKRPAKLRYILWGMGWGAITSIVIICMELFVKHKKLDMGIVAGCLAIILIGCINGLQFWHREAKRLEKDCE